MTRRCWRTAGRCWRKTRVRQFSRPVGIIASAVLHHILDSEDPAGIIRAFRDAVPAGSYLFVSHFRSVDSPELRDIQQPLRDAFGRGQWRTIEQITEYFGDMTLLEPGVVPSARWRPGPGQEVTRRFRIQPPRE